MSLVQTTTLSVQSPRQGLHEFTATVVEQLNQASLRNGLCSLFVQHTSASLTIQENADPSAKHDLEQWLNRLVPEDDPHFTHTFEGADDMPAHIKAALTSTSLTIPVVDGRLQLGTWQGIYLWEHRRARHTRKVLVTLMGE